MSVRRKRYRAVRFFKKFLTFALSRVGLCLFMIGYTMMGAVIFRAIEAPFEEEVRDYVNKRRDKFVDVTWNFIFYNETLGPRSNADFILAEIKAYKTEIHDRIKHGYNLKDAQAIERPQWTTTGAFLYSLTVITTVGYGNIACRTYFGKAITILYAVLGIPLMLLFLAMTGNSLGMTTKFLYRAYVRLKLRIITWNKKRRGAGKVTSVLSQLIRERLYYSAAIYGMVPPGVDADMLNDSRAKVREIVVPVYLSMLIMISYLVAGATLFHFWEEWSFLDSFYFCFISLALIGFGDMFPGAAVADRGEARNKMIICSCYLLFGMALIAMCFQLGQEDVVKNLRRLFIKVSRCFKGEKEDSVILNDLTVTDDLLLHSTDSNGIELNLNLNHVRKNGPSCASSSPLPLQRRPSMGLQRKHSNSVIRRQSMLLRRRSSIR